MAVTFARVSRMTEGSLSNETWSIVRTAAYLANMERSFNSWKAPENGGW